jgi:hypothetical protein
MTDTIAIRPEHDHANTFDGIALDVAQTILFYGQSNAGGGGIGKAVLVDPVFPKKILTFGTSCQISGRVPIDPARLVGTGDLRDHPDYAPFPATAMAHALGHYLVDGPRTYFMHTTWYGSQPLTSFLPGTAAWSNLSCVTQRARDVLSEKAIRSRVAALVLIQGEAGPAGRDKYANVLREFIESVVNKFGAQIDQEVPPKVILLQTNESNLISPSPLGVALAQWDVARNRSSNFALAGPMYQFPISDNVHQSAEGRMMLGDLLAYVYRTFVERDQMFQPLHPAEARLVGSSTVVISFKRPTGSRPLQWDRNWIAPVPNFGFELSDANGPTELMEVQLTGDSEVTIKSLRKLAGSAMLRYAFRQSRAVGWAPCRGQLVAPTTEQSAFSMYGYNLPKTIDHYSVRFEICVN